MHGQSSLKSDAGRPLRLGHDIDLAPFAAVEDGQSTGWLLAAAMRAFAQVGRAAQPVPLALGTFEAALKSGEIDAFVGVAVTEERRARLALSAPLVTTGGAWFRPTRRGGPIRRAATPAGGPLVAVLRRHFPDVAVVETADYAGSLAATLAGEADAAALNLHAGRLLAVRAFDGAFELPLHPFLAIDLAIAVGRSTAALLAPLDRAIAALKADGALPDGPTPNSPI